MEEMTKANPKSDAGKASEGGLKEANLPTPTTGLLGSIVDYLASTSLFSQASAITSSEASDVDQEHVNKLLDQVMR